MYSLLLLLCFGGEVDVLHQNVFEDLLSSKRDDPIAGRVWACGFILVMFNDEDLVNSVRNVCKLEERHVDLKQRSLNCREMSDNSFPSPCQEDNVSLALPIEAKIRA